MPEAHEISTMSDKPEHQRPELPAFWDKRFSEGTMPWAAGGVPAALREFASSIAGTPRVLVPGCGHAWEAAWLASLGWDVTALDFSPAAVAAAREVLGDWPGQLLEADFFSFPVEAPYDIVYERAFLCALPRKCWPDYARRMAALLRPGGMLAGFFFFSEEPKGPPFGSSPADLEMLFSPWFVRIDDRPVTDSLPVFAGRERWQTWRCVS